MAYIFPKKKTYDTPEGNYRAVVVDAFVMKDGILRIVFKILSLPHKLLIYLAGKNYKPGKLTLADDLIEWLGVEKTDQIVKTDGSVDVEKLVGLHADIRIEHYQGDGYDGPCSLITAIKPPGELTPDYQSAA